MKRDGAPRVLAILSYDCFDPWLDGIGQTIQSFGSELIGSWMFNYVQALRRVGVRSVLFFTSSRVGVITKLVHAPTGATICVLPSSKAYDLLNRLHARLKQAAVAGGRISLSRRVALRLLGVVSSYLSTPLRALHRELRREGCDCVLVEQYEEPRFDVTVLLGRATGLPVFGMFAAVAPASAWWMRPLRALAFRLSAGLVISSTRETQRIGLQYRILSTKMGLIYYPVDLDLWYPEPKADMRDALGIPASARVAIFHGGIDIWWKGLDVLIESWEQICLDRPADDLRLILVGRGGDSARLSEILGSRRLRGITWLNQWVNDGPTIRRYLSSADLYVFPSRLDGFGISVIEAMACGLPVVAASAAGIPDIFVDGEQSGGLVVATGDPTAFTAAMTRLLYSPDLAEEMGRSARRRVSEAFSPDTIGGQLRDFLFDAAGRVDRR